MTAHAIRLEQLTNARDDVVHSRHMGEDIVGMDNVGSIPVCFELPGEIVAKEFRDRRNATSLRRHGAILERGLDAENGNTRAA